NALAYPELPNRPRAPTSFSNCTHLSAPVLAAPESLNLLQCALVDWQCRTHARFARTNFESDRPSGHSLRPKTVTPKFRRLVYSLHYECERSDGCGRPVRGALDQFHS